MASKSLWMDIDVAPDAEVIDGVHECEVAVIGSGIAGLSTAYELCNRENPLSSLVVAASAVA
jgi:cation diffusion facilitator CzcD-associated flavoprotein CzcO